MEPLKPLSNVSNMILPNGWTDRDFDLQNTKQIYGPFINIRNYESRRKQIRKNKI